MIQKTFAQARPELSQVMGMTGMSLTDARYKERVNMAQQEIINLGDFPGVVDRWHLLFDEITGQLVLPYYLDRLMQVTVDRVPSQIMSPWAEFVNYGVGPQDDTLLAEGGTSNLSPRCWYRDCLDRGEVVSRWPVPAADGPWVLRCYAEVDEAVNGQNPVINLQGYKDKKVIRSLTDGTSGDWYNGEDLEISNAVPYTESTHEFDSLSAVVKPQTNGYVTIKAWNGVDLVTLSDYAPVETTPSYRAYFIPQLYRPQQGIRDRVILARARRRFIPVEEDQDVLIIGNIPALKAMIQSQWMRDAGKKDDAEYYQAICVRILDQEATAYRGKSRTPAISFTRGFGIGTSPNIH